MMNNPLISIGITCFREGQWLQDSWESVLEQTDLRWEAIMILDGGADKPTKSIFDSIEHPRLKKYSLVKNVGPYLCRTLAILNSSTDWYAHLDADDLLPKEAVALILDAIQNNQKGEFVFGDSLHFDNDNEEIRLIPDFNEDLLITSLKINGQSPIKRNLFWKLGGFAPELISGGADWDFWIGVTEKQITGCRADGIIYKRRSRHGSVGGNRRFGIDLVAQTVINRHPDFFSIGNRRNLCLGKAYELIARNYRSTGKSKLAAEYAKKAVSFGESTETLEEIIREQRMNPLRYGIRRLARKVGM